MSMNAIQKHRLPGLGSGSFGSKGMGVNTKTSGVSSQAAKNLQNTSAASTSNSVFNGMFKKSSSFNRISGQNTLKGRNQVDLSRRRASLGNNGISRTTASSTPVYVASTGVQSGQHMSGFEKAMMYAQIGMQAFQMGSQLFGGVSNGQQLTSAMNGMGGNNQTTQLASTAGQSAVSSMQNAQTSGELSGAISNAESQLSSMQQAATSGNFETQANDAKTNMDTYKSDVSKSKDGVKTAEQNLKNADNGVKTATDLRDSRLLALKNADAQYGAAVEARVQAQDGATQAAQNLSNAETTLANTPQTITGPDGKTSQPNPKYEAAKQAVETAKQAKQAADAKLETAKQAETQAESTRDTTNTAANEAKTNLDKAENTLSTQKEKQTNAQNALQTADANYQKAEQTYQEAQNAVQQFQDSQHDIKELESEITKQKERLTKMKNKENKKLDKLSNKIDKAATKNEKSNSKIDASNGMNLREKYFSNNIERRNNKNAARLAQKEAILQGQKVPGEE